MNYHNITYPDMNNGDGLRVVLWLSGCSHHCKECQNSQTWDIGSGIKFDDLAKKELFEELSRDYISGITLTGGDPLHENNVSEVLNLLNEIRLSFRDKTIWIYSGYTWEQINSPIITTEYNPRKTKLISDRKRCIELCDVFVDGKFMNDKKDVSLKWRGSSNQRVINVKETLRQNKIVLHCE